MSDLFDTPLRSAALGVLIVAGFTMVSGLLLGCAYRKPVLILNALALTMVLISEVLQ